MKNPGRLALCILLCEGVGLAGAAFTSASLAEWYPALPKPSFTPPGWLFGPVWTALFALMGVALYWVWGVGPREPRVRRALLLFSAQLGLNLLWSALFFGLRSPVAALAEIFALWGAIAATTVEFRRVSPRAGWLLVPYLGWVAFAAALNYGIVAAGG